MTLSQGLYQCDPTAADLGGAGGTTDLSGLLSGGYGGTVYDTGALGGSGMNGGYFDASGGMGMGGSFDSGMSY